MHIKWMHGQWEIVYVLSDRLNIVKLLLHCIVHIVTLLSTHFQTSYVFNFIFNSHLQILHHLSAWS